MSPEPLGSSPAGVLTPQHTHTHRGRWIHTHAECLRGCLHTPHLCDHTLKCHPKQTIPASSDTELFGVNSIFILLSQYSVNATLLPLCSLFQMGSHFIHGLLHAPVGRSNVNHWWNVKDSHPYVWLR